MARRFVSAIVFAASIAAISQCGGGNKNPIGGDNQAAAALSGVPLTGDSVIGGNSIQGNATLTANAPAGGATVTLSSNNGAATVPGSVSIAAGAATAGYTVTTSSVSTATSVTITGSYLGVSKTATLTVNPAPVTVRADFTVTPDANTTAPAGQCSVTKTTSGNTENILRCRFDASSSTPNPGITDYRWQFPGAIATTTTTGISVTDTHVACGTFSGAAERDVTLTVTAPQGTNSVTKRITFVKSGEC
jgi:hypothetical protein